ncbi:MAG: ABC transporter permease [Vicinamibacterales bacterium]
MLKGLWKLTWLEIKIFLREPLGAIGTILLTVAVFVVLGRLMGRPAGPQPLDVSRFVSVGLPVLVALSIAISAVLSLVTIISIYREGGILKRLRATPLRPHTILTAHVLVKLILTALTITLTVGAGRRYFSVSGDPPFWGFALAVLIGTLSLLSIGFVIASLVPTARFAQPVGAGLFYPMIGLSGLFVAIDRLPPALRAVANVNPITYATSLLEGIWTGDAWGAHAGDLAALAVCFVLGLVISARVFRWE